MPRQPRYVKNKRVGSRGTVIRGDQIYTTLQGLVGGPTGQKCNEVSNTQRYDLGARLVKGDGRVFRYGRCGASLTDMKHGVKNYNPLVTELAEIVSACAAGATSLTVTFDGDFWTKDTLAKDELYGGYISLYNGTDVRDQRMIISNTALTEGGACTIGIDEPIVTAVGSAFKCEVLTNPYHDLRNINDGFSSVMGMPAALPTTGQYFWIQTWGPIRITPVGAELGTAHHERGFLFDAFGSLISVYASTVTNTRSEQLAGFIIERTGGTAGSAAPFIMLQISP